MADGKKKQLGRGLSALLGEAGTVISDEEKKRLTRMVPVANLHPGKFQPRLHVDEDRIEELAQSIREKGVLQPLLVRRHPELVNDFEIIAGERRWRASQRAQLHEVPVIIKDLNDREALEVALVENLQRQDLSPLEEAEGYRRLMEEFSHTQQELADAMAKSRSHVANMLRLLSLPDPLKGMLSDGRLTSGHARALLNAPNPEVLAERVVRQNLNVRQTEKLVQNAAGRTARRTRRAIVKDADTLALERDLSNLLGLKVDIRFDGSGGSLTIEYRTLEQLDDLLSRLSEGGMNSPTEGDDEPEGTDFDDAELSPIPAVEDAEPIASWEAETAVLTPVREAKPLEPMVAAVAETEFADPDVSTFDPNDDGLAPVDMSDLDAVLLGSAPDAVRSESDIIDTRDLDALLAETEKTSESEEESTDLDDSFDLEEDESPMPVRESGRPDGS